jgi:hypothetical protein
VIHTDPEGGTSQAPVLHYVVNNVPYDVQSRIFTSSPAYTVGQKVTILYSPGKPGDGQIDSVIEQNFVAPVLGGLGTVILVVGIGGILYGRHPAR